MGWQRSCDRPRCLKVVDAKALVFTDVPGNQHISVGNLAHNDRVALILVDHAHRQRLKLLGRLSMRESAGQGRPEQEMTIRVKTFDWNCPQHIPVHLEAEAVQSALDKRDKRIAQLEAMLAEATRNAAPSLLD